MRNKEANKQIIKIIAQALGDINEKVVFVGGAIVSMYATDEGAEDVRVTKDVDITLQLATYGDLAKLTEELAKKGFYPASEERIICRFKYNEILVDVMSTKQIGWAPSNPWFEPGFKSLIKINVEGIDIRIFPVSYFLATKFEAFHGRGKDPRTSHDFEDIVYVLNNCSSIVEEVLSSPGNLKEYLKNEFSKIISAPEFKEAVLGHLPFELQSERYKMVTEKLKNIVESNE